MLLGRRVIASDVNPYAFVLTKAKLHAPKDLASGLDDFSRLYSKAMERPSTPGGKIPDWVSRFFHPKTLKETIKVADELIARREWFFMACLLGILHHQRPGFLSFPSSHLVPYLRDKKYPRAQFPDMYEYRDLKSRMEAKITRALRVANTAQVGAAEVRRSRIEGLTLPNGVDAIITSPPYMNALDYRRDNRLRLWLLDRSTTNYASEPTDRKAGIDSMVDSLVQHASVSLRKGGRLVLVVGESVVRKKQQSHPSFSYLEAIKNTGMFELEDAIRDYIPDVRRSRRDYQATKAEHVLVLKKIRAS